MCGGLAGLMSPRAPISRPALIAVMGLSGGADTRARYRGGRRDAGGKEALES